MTMRGRGAVLLMAAAALSLAACDTGYVPPPRLKDRAMPDLPDVQTRLAFTCVTEKERIPPRDPEADQLYAHARWLKKNNLLKEDPSVYPTIERLIRIATAYGHDKANLELRQMIGKGQAVSDDPVKETLDLTEDLIKRGIPGGYYDMGRYLERGYGLKKDPDLARKYYRKAADLGSPEAQYAVGEMLDSLDETRNIANQMHQCAAEQGHGKAALGYAIGQKILGHYPQALLALQLGIKAGDAESASRLSKGLLTSDPKDDMYYLGVNKDTERANRYEAIFHVLASHSYLNPKVPEIDRILPLPPAKLPPWDGKLQWLKEHEANVPPPLPSEERIAEMARAKNLDPATGRPRT